MASLAASLFPHSINKLSLRKGSICKPIRMVASRPFLNAPVCPAEFSFLYYFLKILLARFLSFFADLVDEWCPDRRTRLCRSALNACQGVCLLLGRLHRKPC